MQLLTALTSDNSLVLFDPTNPGQVRFVPVTGVTGTLLGIDTRPANGLIYGLTTTNNLYTINPNTGAATFVSTLSQPFQGGTVSGFDFNPVPDRLRLVGDNNQNFRINVDTGAVIVDGALSFAAGDLNAGVNPNASASGYTNSFAGTTSTQLFNIDPLLDSLVLQNPPNDGTLVTVGGLGMFGEGNLGVDFSNLAGFDIVPTGNGGNAAFAVANATLYSINLTTGAASSLGAVGNDPTLTLQGLTNVPGAQFVPSVAADTQFIALNGENTLLTFNPGRLGQVTSVPVTGLVGTLLGIDRRPANGLIYGITTANNIYTINPNTGAATFVSTLSQPFQGGTVSGFDFNPVPDRLRLVGDNDQNFRINVDTGAVTVDGTLAFVATDVNAGVNPNITAAGYTNAFAGATTTQLFDIDPLLDTLLLQNPPNDGGLVTVGELGVDFDNLGGFDTVPALNGGTAAFAVSDSTLYAIDLVTGMAFNLGAIAAGTATDLKGFTIIPGDGIFDGRVDSPASGTFDAAQYLASNRDLITAFGLNLDAASQHFNQFGRAENRTIDGFDEILYLASHGDLIAAFGFNPQSATEHFIRFGAAEGRATNLFNPLEYLNNFADLRAAFGNDLFAATRHFIQTGFAEGRTDD